MSTKAWPNPSEGDLPMKQFLLDFLHAETSNRQVNTLSRALLAAVVATAVAFARAHGYPV